MRTPAPAQGRTLALTREKLPPPRDLGRGPGARGSSERPGSIREAIVRWLDEEP
jgi:hypothetical protein